MHRDLQIRDLKDDDRHRAFVTLGQPDIHIHDEPNGEISVELLGYDTYDPATGGTKPGGPLDIACWMLDTAYDGTSFFARRIHFPNAQDDRQLKRLRAQLGKTLDNVRWNATLSIRSATVHWERWRAEQESARRVSRAASRHRCTDGPAMSRVGHTFAG